MHAKYSNVLLTVNTKYNVSLPRVAISHSKMPNDHLGKKCSRIIFASLDFIKSNLQNIKFYKEISCHHPNISNAAL